MLVTPVHLQAGFPATVGISASALSRYRLHRTGGRLRTGDGWTPRGRGTV